MSKIVKEEYPGIEDIRSDLDALRSNVVELTRHIQQNGAGHIHEITEDISDMAHKRAETLRKAGKRELKKFESQVKAHPGQSVALAFAAGMALSMLAGGRR